MALRKILTGALPNLFKVDEADIFRAVLPVNFAELFNDFKNLVEFYRREPVQAVYVLEIVFAVVVAGDAVEVIFAGGAANFLHVIADVAGRRVVQNNFDIVAHTESLGCQHDKFFAAADGAL